MSASNTDNLRRRSVNNSNLSKRMSTHQDKDDWTSDRNEKLASDIDQSLAAFNPHVKETTATTTGRRSSIELGMDEVNADSFEKVKVIGVGSFGHVYLARLRGTDQIFAMKELRKSELVTAKKIKHVLNEHDILAATDFPFTTSLYYSFQTESFLYFVMEYCGGGEFYRLLQNEKTFDEQIVKFYASEVLLALEYLHAMGIIYRDLKPENILLHETGHIRLADFGLSKITKGKKYKPVIVRKVKAFFRRSKPKLSTARVCRSNSFVGTLEYLAPEVINGSGHDSSVDWWTFGILLYEMMFGCPPFHGEDHIETFGHISNGRVVFPKDKHCSRHLKDLIRKLLAVDPNKRLGSKYGASQVKDHPFFKHTQWALLHHVKAPIIPKIEDAMDLRNFDFNKIQTLIAEEEKAKRNSSGSVMTEISQDFEKSFQNFSGHFQQGTDVECFRWYERKASGSHPSAEKYYSISQVGSGLYVFGGGVGNVPSATLYNSVHLLDSKSLSWVPLEITGPSPKPRWRHTGTTFGNCVYVFGGHDGSRWLNDVCIFDTESLSWKFPEQRNPIPLARDFHSSTAVDDRMLVFGGWNGDKVFNDLWSLDTKSGKWTQPKTRGTPPGRRSSHSATLIGQNIYIFGGFCFPSKSYNDLKVLDTVTMTWSEPDVQGKCPAPRHLHSCCTMSNHLLVFGGDVRYKASTEFHILYPSKDGHHMSWHMPFVGGASLPPTFGYHLCQVGKQIFLLGGEEAGSFGKVHVLFNADTILSKR